MLTPEKERELREDAAGEPNYHLFLAEIDRLRREVEAHKLAGRIQAQALLDADAQIEALREALAKIAEKQQNALRICRDNGFVFEDIGNEPGNWQHLAFTLYNEICEIDVWARHALDIEIGEVAAPVSKGGEADAD